MKGLPIEIKDDRGFNKKVGSLELGRKGRIYRKAVRRARHYFNVVKGYGIQKEVFDHYLRGRKGRILIYEKDTGRTLIASIDTWTKHSRSGNYGDGKQIFLSERFMYGGDGFDRSVIA